MASNIEAKKHDEGYRTTSAKQENKVAELTFELEKKHQEIRVLQGKIRGYQTLSQLLQDARSDAHSYRKKYYTLVHQLDKSQETNEDILLNQEVSIPESCEPPSRSSLPKLVSDIAAVSPSEVEVQMSDRDLPVVENDAATDSESCDLNVGSKRERENEEDPSYQTDIHLSDSQSPVVTETCQMSTVISKEQTFNPVSDHPDAKEDEKTNSSEVAEKNRKETRSRTDKKETSFLSQASGVSIQDEWSVPSMPKSGNDSSLTFPSLSSETKDAYMVQMEDLQIEPGIRNEGILGTFVSPQLSPVQIDGNLSKQVNKLATTLRRMTGGCIPNDVALDLSSLAINISKREKDVHLQKVMIENLGPKNEELQMQLAVLVPDLERKVEKLSTENRVLLKKIKALQHERDHMRESEIPSSEESVSWNKVQQMAENDETSRGTEVPKLQEEISRLSLKTQKWSLHCEDMKKKFEEKLELLRTELSKKEELLRHCEIKSQKNAEVLLVAQQKNNELKSSKESILKRMESQQQEIHKLKMKLFTEQDHVKTLTAQQTALQAQLAHYRECLASASLNIIQQPSLAEGQTSHSSAMDDMKTRIELLQQQVGIYKDDFDKEREDRERAQQEKDTLQRKVEELTQELSISRSRLSQATKVPPLAAAVTPSPLGYVRNPPVMPYIYQPPPTDPVEAIANTPTEWSCVRCTYKNIPERGTCELCGKVRVPSIATEYPNIRTQNRDRMGHHHERRTLISRAGVEECDQGEDGHLQLVTQQEDLIMDK